MKYFILITILFIAGCTQQNLGGITQIEMELGGEKILIGGQHLLGATVGDGKEDFKPEVTLEKWQGEDYLRVWSDDTGDKTASQEGEKVVWQTPIKEYNFYTKTFEGNDAFEYEIILKEKPATNVIVLNIETSGFDFYYQPELTQEEIDRGDIRPENVVGSYAVYHKTKKNHIIGQKNYKTGKAFHIYRPKIINNNGDWIWGELNISGNKLTITIDQNWLDNAVYPVIVDPTFGYTSIGGTNGNAGANTANFTKGTPADGDGTVSKYSHYGRDNSGTTNAKVMLWNFSGLTLIANSVSDPTSVNSSTPQWWDYTGATPSVTNGTDYYVGIISEALMNLGVYYDTVSNEGGFDTGNSYATPTNLSDPLTDTDNKNSIYATYTASGGATPAEEKGEDIIWF